MKKFITTTALSLFLLTGMAFAQTAALDAQQERLDALNKELEEAQRSSLVDARADQLHREAFEQQTKEISEQEHRNNISRLDEQVALENQRAERQEAELKRIEELLAQIAQESESLRVARLEEYNRRIEAERHAIEELKKQRIATLQSQIDEQQRELEVLQSELEAAQNA